MFQDYKTTRLFGGSSRCGVLTRSPLVPTQKGPCDRNITRGSFTSYRNNSTQALQRNSADSGDLVRLARSYKVHTLHLHYYYTTYCKRYGIPECPMNEIVLAWFIRGPDDDSKESKHVALR